MKTTEIGRKRLRAVAHRLTREGDDHTMSGTFGQYHEGDAVVAALDDMEACLGLLRDTLEAFDDAGPDGHVDMPILRIRALLAEASR